MTDTDVATWFWDIIEQADRSRERLGEILSTLSKDEIYRFQNTFVELSVELQDEPYSRYADADESEDGIEDIANWVVSQGRARYYEVIEEPRNFPGHVDTGAPDDLFGVAYDVYYRRFDEPLEII